MTKSSSYHKLLVWLVVVVLSLGLLSNINSAKADQTPKAIGVYYVPMTFMFDGSMMAPPESQRGFIYQDTAYVPLRFISYALSKSVQWEGDSYTVRILEPNSIERVSIDEYKLNHTIKKNLVPVDSAETSETTIDAYFETVNYVFDGDSRIPPIGNEGMIIEGSLYVPIRFLSEAIGKTINWDPQTYTIRVESVAAPKPTPEPKPTTTPTPMPTPKPTPNPSVPAIGGGGSGGGTVQPARVPYATIISEAEAQMLALQNTAKNRLTAIKTRYDAEKDNVKRNAIISEGLAVIAEIDAQFYSILNQLETRLSSNQYETSVVASYRERYEAEKEAQYSKLK